jgi:hypothetical protein
MEDLRTTEAKHCPDHILLIKTGYPLTVGAHKGEYRWRILYYEKTQTLSKKSIAEIRKSVTGGIIRN